MDEDIFFPAIPSFLPPLQSHLPPLISIGLLKCVHEKVCTICCRRRRRRFASPPYCPQPAATTQNPLKAISETKDECSHSWCVICLKVKSCFHSPPLRVRCVYIILVACTHTHKIYKCTIYYNIGIGMCSNALPKTTGRLDFFAARRCHKRNPCGLILLYNI